MKDPISSIKLKHKKHKKITPTIIRLFKTSDKQKLHMERKSPLLSNKRKITIGFSSKQRKSEEIKQPVLKYRKENKQSFTYHKYTFKMKETYIFFFWTMKTQKNS